MVVEEEYEKMVLVLNMNCDDLIIDVCIVDEVLVKMSVVDNFFVDCYLEKRFKVFFKVLFMVFLCLFDV